MFLFYRRGKKQVVPNAMFGSKAGMEAQVSCDHYQCPQQKGMTLEKQGFHLQRCSLGADNWVPITFPRDTSVYKKKPSQSCARMGSFLNLCSSFKKKVTFLLIHTELFRLGKWNIFNFLCLILKSYFLQRSRDCI